MGKLGAPVGNENALKHGGRIKRNRRGAMLPSLMKRYPFIYRAILEYRRSIEDAIVAAGREVTTADDTLILAAMTSELTARVALDLVASGKSTDDVRDLKTACWAREKAQGCIDRLGIGGAIQPPKGKGKGKESWAFAEGDQAEADHPSAVDPEV